MLAHWDDVEEFHAELAHLGAIWQDLGRAAGTRSIGVKRIRIDPGKWSTPVHKQTAEEEVFYVVRGSGVALLDDEVCDVRAGDCLVHLAGAETHSLRAGDDGLDVLAFGTRVRNELGYLPRAGVAWVGRGLWIHPNPGEDPWDLEVAAGEPEVPDPTERPPNVVNVADVEGEYEGRWRPLAAAGGSQLTGLNWARLEDGEEGAPPHVHSVDEELYVVLEGDGEIELHPSPQRRREGRELERHPVRAGHVVAFPPGGAMGHGIRAGVNGMTYLAYGTRNAGDTAYYPRSNKIFFRGLGLIARLEDLDYDDGEPA